ncbi:hypothetical protein ACQP25_44320 (plasmid) [Microtetraspora malaysiensis]|uniref:hypothetical protein n=1 Tax=Microtetraspora malaysiensis TaxID=161358 RepID=UPI003D8E01E9
MNTTTQQQTNMHWSLLASSTVGKIGQASLGLVVASTVGHNLIHLHPAWAVGATTVGVVGTVLTGQHRTPSALAYRLGCWLGAGSWLTWTWLAGPWSIETGAALGVGALAAAITAPLSRRVKPRPSVTGSMLNDKPIGGMITRRQVSLAEEWVARIRRVADVRVRVEQIIEWGNGYGFSALLIQPPGRPTTSILTNSANGLADDKHLPNGCGVEFTPGPYRGSLWMHVSTVNALTQTIPHPGIRFGKSINDPDTIRLGQHRDGSLAAVALRESTMILAGQKRSGKSGTLHNMTADAGAAGDCVVWHLDLNGGGISRPWLRPWLHGRTDRPAIDWAAPCREEGLLMARAIIDIALDRKSAHAELKAHHNVQLLPVSRDVPEILIIMDEGKEVLGTKITDAVIQRIRALLAQLVDIGGNEACNAVLSVLRSVSTALSTDILKQCGTRATMRVTDQSELDFLFGYHKGITPQDAPEQGSGFLQKDNANGPRPFKAYFMLPSDIENAAVQIAERRPDLDAAAVRAAGEAYATRYERMRWLFSTPAEREHLHAPDPITLPGLEDDGPWYPAGNAPLDEEQDGTIERRRTGRLVVVQPGGVTSGWGSPEKVAARYRPTSAPRPRAVQDEPQWKAEQIHTIPASTPDVIARCLAVFQDVGASRLHSEELAAALDCTVTELAEMLRPYGVQARPNAFWRDGERRRGYDRADLLAATQRDHHAGDEDQERALETAT